VRTSAERDTFPQLSYYRPGIALDPFYDPEPLVRRLQCLRMMKRSEHPEYAALAQEFLAGADLETVIRALGAQLEVLGFGEEFEALQAGALARFGELGARVAEMMEEQARMMDLARRRRLIQDPDHRFFLALLLNLPSREQIFDFIRRRYGRPPVELIMEWVGALAESRPEGLEGLPNALGIHLGEVEQLVLCSLLEDRSLAQIKEQLEEEFVLDEEQEGDLRELCEAFRGSSFFRPLFR
jgi:hypothetical protein